MEFPVVEALGALTLLVAALGKILMAGLEARSDEIKRQSERIASLETRLDDALKERLEVEARIDEMQGQIASLERDKLVMEANIAELRREIAELTILLTEKTQQLEVVQGERDELADQVATLELQLEELKTQLSEALGK